MASIFITRTQYDFLINMAQPLLQRAVDGASDRRWSLAGVEYTGLDWDLVTQIEEALGLGSAERPDYVEFPAGEFAPQANVGPLR